MASNILQNGIKAKHLKANTVIGTMCVPCEQKDSTVIRGDDMNLGEPQRRVVAYEIPTGDWLEVIYV